MASCSCSWVLIATAYDAFAHAHELDRSNVQVLATMTQLALLSSDHRTSPTSRPRRSHCLRPTIPRSPWSGAIPRSRQATSTRRRRAPTRCLQARPTIPSRTVLKARVLIAEGKSDDAVSLLENQHQAVPEDRGAIRALAAIYQARGDWRNVARIQFDAHRLDPRDSGIALARDRRFPPCRQCARPRASCRCRSSLHAADPQAGRANPGPVGATCAAMGSSCPTRCKLGAARRAMRGCRSRNISTRPASPPLPRRLLGGAATAGHACQRAARMPSSPSRWHFSEQTRRPSGCSTWCWTASPIRPRRFVGAHASKPRTGAAKQAVIDAQRLVTISPDSAPDRLLLAHAFLAAHNGEAVRRTLWQAFQDLPDDERHLFGAQQRSCIDRGHRRAAPAGRGICGRPRRPS